MTDILKTAPFLTTEFRAEDEVLAVYDQCSCGDHMPKHTHIKRGKDHYIVVTSR